MIKIDLLPLAYRKDYGTKKIYAPVVIYFVTLFVLALHLIFFVLNVYKKVQVGALNQTWEASQPQSREINLLKDKLAVKSEKVRVLDKVLGRNIYFTELFNKINQAVPKGLWLNRLSFSYNGLVLGGSVFSFGTEEVSLVNKFFNGLKNDVFFEENFINFNLDSVQRRVIAEYEILDFLLTADVKTERFKVGFSN